MKTLLLVLALGGVGGCTEVLTTPTPVLPVAQTLAVPTGCTTELTPFGYALRCP
jgi:hypothetical protein